MLLVPRELHRRVGIRDQCAGGLRSRRVGSGHRQGRAQGITEYGTETMHVLRAEKGYIIVGQDTDGTVTPDDAGLSWAIGKNKAGLRRQAIPRSRLDEIAGSQTAGRLAHQGPTHGARGRRASRREAAARNRRWNLIGHVTSSYASSVLGHSIALAVVAGGRARLGQTLFMCPCRGGDIEVEVLRPSSTTRPERASMADHATRRLPAVPATPWMKALPPAMRFILHGGRARARGRGSRLGRRFR